MSRKLGISSNLHSAVWGRMLLPRGEAWLSVWGAQQSTPAWVLCALLLNHGSGLGSYWRSVFQMEQMGCWTGQTPGTGLSGQHPRCLSADSALCCCIKAALLPTRVVLDGSDVFTLSCSTDTASPCCSLSKQALHTGIEQSLGILCHGIVLSVPAAETL